MYVIIFIFFKNDFKHNCHNRFIILKSPILFFLKCQGFSKCLCNINYSLPEVKPERRPQEVYIQDTAWCLKCDTNGTLESSKITMCRGGYHWQDVSVSKVERYCLTLPGWVCCWLCEVNLIYSRLPTDWCISIYMDEDEPYLQPLLCKL